MELRLYRTLEYLFLVAISLILVAIILSLTFIVVMMTGTQMASPETIEKILLPGIFFTSFLIALKKYHLLYVLFALFIPMFIFGLVRRYARIKSFLILIMLALGVLFSYQNTPRPSTIAPAQAEPDVSEQIEDDNSWMQQEADRMNQDTDSIPQE